MVKLQPTLASCITKCSHNKPCDQHAMCVCVWGGGGGVRDIWCCRHQMSTSMRVSLYFCKLYVYLNSPHRTIVSYSATETLSFTEEPRLFGHYMFHVWQMIIVCMYVCMRTLHTVKQGCYIYTTTLHKHKTMWGVATTPTGCYG